MMQFIVLGYIPGTEVQIGFDNIATMFCIVSFAYLISLLYKEKSRILTEAINKIQYLTI